MTTPNTARSTEAPIEPRTMGFENPRVRRVFMNPAIWEIFGALIALEKCSVADIARFTARSRTSIYPHLQKLIDLEIAEEFGTQLMGKRYEKLYRPTVFTISSRFDQGDPESLEFHIGFAKALARFLARKYERAASSPGALSRTDERNIHVGTHNAWVDKAQLAELNTMINNIWEFCDDTRYNADKQLIHVGIFESFQPIPEDPKNGADPKMPSSEP